jgi:hypothetical protein
LNPKWHPNYKQDGQYPKYCLLLVQAYEIEKKPKKLSNKPTDKDSKKQLIWFNKNFEHVKPKGSELILSIPIQYYPVLCYINFHIHHWYQILTDGSMGKTLLKVETYEVLHLLSFFHGLRECFLWEIIHTHFEDQMTSTWTSATLHEFLKFITLDHRKVVFNKFNEIRCDSNAKHKRFMIQTFGESVFSEPLNYPGK